MNSNPAPVRIASPSSGDRRVPRHIGFIPDGNRRWAVQHGLSKDQGYSRGIAPGLALFEACKTLGVEVVSVYGFTQDNTRRPTEQAQSFRAVCVAFALEVSRRGAALLVVGDEQSRQFPADLAAFRVRQGQGIKVNFLVNCGWEWDLAGLKNGELRSADVMLLGTPEQVRLAVQAATEMVAGRNVETAALVVSLRTFIREVLDLDAVPADVSIPSQGPLRPAAAGSRAVRGERAGGTDRGLRADPGGEGAGAGVLGTSHGLEAGASGPDASVRA